MHIRHHNRKGTVTSVYFKDYVEGKLEKIKKHPFRASKIDVTAAKQGNFYVVELCLRGQKEVRSSAMTHNFMDSFDQALHKALKQMNKLKLSVYERRREQRKSKRDVMSHNLEHVEIYVGDKKAA